MISVLMPNFNYGAYIGEAIQSILNQTYRDLELIIIEGGSTDGSQEVEKSFSDRRVRVVEERGRGIARALNRGIDEAEGEFIARQDADDVSAPTRFEKQIKIMKGRPEVGMVHTGAWTMDAAGRRIGSLTNGYMRLLWPDGDPARALLTWNCVIGGSALIRADLLRRFRYDEREFMAEDWGLWLRMVRLCRFAKVQEELYGYRVHSEQTTGFKHLVRNCVCVTRNFSRWMQDGTYTGTQRRTMFATILLYWLALPDAISRKTRGKM